VFRYPILVVAHASHKERWTVTKERLILVGSLSSRDSDLTHG
jgi:hypothetical protein